MEALQEDGMKKFFVLFSITFMALFGSCSSSYKSVKAVLPDLSNRADGVYRGEYSVSGTPNKATVEVTLQDKSITAIKIVRHFCSSIGRKAEKITDKVIEQQSLSVDAISGATSSSIAILKAIENALQAAGIEP
jgi:uncharacterized protein with FMN-binding domain